MSSLSSRIRRARKEFVSLLSVVFVLRNICPPTFRRTHCWLMLPFRVSPGDLDVVVVVVVVGVTGLLRLEFPPFVWQKWLCCCSPSPTSIPFSCSLTVAITALDYDFHTLIKRTRREQNHMKSLKLPSPNVYLLPECQIVNITINCGWRFDIKLKCITQIQYQQRHRRSFIFLFRSIVIIHSTRHNMASVKVITPNYRHLIVKVSPNMTLLQVINCIVIARCRFDILTFPEFIL